MSNIFFSVVVPHGIKNLTSILITDDDDNILANLKRGRSITLKENVVVDSIEVPGGEQGFIEEVIPKKDTNLSKIKVYFGPKISKEPVELSLIKLACALHYN